MNDHRPKDMRRDFADRADLIAYLKAEFPEAAKIDDHVPETRGGRKAALQRLDQVDPDRYAATRNRLDGAVTRLSPYIRYGVITLPEARDHALRRVKRYQAQKFVNELAWRDYWQRVYRKLGDRVWKDQEPYKTGFTAQHYADALPQDVERGESGRVCMDSFSRELHENGYLHNHARMWMAAYLIHWRRVKWQSGARWFLKHLLDGDPASNNLSWQWVASTFSQKPYFMNRENIERFTNGVYCRRCPLYGRCDFEGSYEMLERKLFPNKPPSEGEL